MIETARLRLEPLSRIHLEPWLRFMMDGDARAGLHTPDPAESEEQAAAQRSTRLSLSPLCTRWWFGTPARSRVLWASCRGGWSGGTRSSSVGCFYRSTVASATRRKLARAPATRRHPCHLSHPHGQPRVGGSSPGDSERRRNSCSNTGVTRRASGCLGWPGEPTGRGTAVLMLFGRTVARIRDLSETNAQHDQPFVQWSRATARRIVRLCLHLAPSDTSWPAPSAAHRAPRRPSAAGADLAVTLPKWTSHRHSLFTVRDARRPSSAI